ncbi:hypothetical protein MLD38_017965 [Melastoma candidum]|uniref:Uncharacterized protein n=1 Tax=Melastoma candidum TaxID=119954 RepID=A0ACB9QRT0_9MYRT|nr:hypothetical protein MLD38_017965 [Melastoma candidum]
MDNMQPSPTMSLLGIKDKVESTGIHFSRVDDIDEGDKLLGLGPDEMMRLDEFLLQDKGIDLDMGLEGFKHGKPTETEKDVVTASYGESNGNNNSSSSSVNDWFDWEWMTRKDEEASDNNSSKGSQFMFM